MRRKTVSVPLNMSAILMRRVVELLCCLQINIIPDHFEKEYNQFVEALKGNGEIDHSLSESIAKLLKEYEGSVSAEDLINNLKMKRGLRKIYSDGKIIDSGLPVSSDELKQLDLSLAKAWMLTDEMLAVEALANLDGQLQRMLLLSTLATKKAMSDKVRKYLAQATKCFLQELNEACIIVCRAVLEDVLEEKLKLVGLNISALEDTLKGGFAVRLIDSCWRKGIIDETMRNDAHFVRKHANRALHQRKEFSSALAFVCLTKTREILDYLCH